MSRERLILLSCLIGFFIVLSGVFLWAQIFDSMHSLPPGTKPPPPASIAPKLPPLRRSDPVLGTNDRNRLTIVEFADFNCVYCRLSAPQIKTALLPFVDQIRFIWRDLPLAVDTIEGRLPATAGRCALEQQKFWEMHDALLVSPSLDIETMKRLGQQQGLDRSRFESCLESDRYAKALQDDVALARRHGIYSGPTFFIGKRVVDGYISQSELQQIIQEELANPSR